MKYGFCKDCKKFKPLTKHSKIGGHQKPFIYLCRICHDKIHQMNPPKTKQNKKYQKGTPKNKRK